MCPAAGYVDVHDIWETGTPLPQRPFDEAMEFDRAICLAVWDAVPLHLITLSEHQARCGQVRYFASIHAPATSHTCGMEAGATQWLRLHGRGSEDAFTTHMQDKGKGRARQGESVSRDSYRRHRLPHGHDQPKRVFACCVPSVMLPRTSPHQHRSRGRSHPWHTGG